MDDLPFKCDQNYILDILKPKWIENLYADHFTLGRYILHAISLLSTYAGFTGSLRTVNKIKARPAHEILY